MGEPSGPDPDLYLCKNLIFIGSDITDESMNYFQIVRDSNLSP